MSYLKLVFCWMIVYFSLAALVMNGWLSLWILMESVLLMLIGMAAMGEGYSTTEFMIKYFIFQSLMGLFLVGCIMVNSFMVGSWVEWIIFSSVLAKLGLVPFHFWFICVIGKLDWLTFTLMMSLVKLIPVMMYSYLMELTSTMFVLSASLMTGSLAPLGETQVQKLLGYSGMVGTVWLMVATTLGSFFFFFFWIGYAFSFVLVCYIFFFMDVFYINQFKMVSLDSDHKVWFFCVSLSLAGVPPFLGFVMKWLISWTVFYTGLLYFTVLLVSLALFSLYYYLHLWYFFMFIHSFDSKWYSFNLNSSLWWISSCWFFVSFGFVYLFY